MARLVNQKRHTRPPPDGSWLFEGHEEDSNDSQSDGEHRDEPKASASLHTSTIQHDTASQFLPASSSHILNSKQFDSPTFPPSLDGRSMSSSRTSAAGMRKSRRLEQSTGSIKSQEPTFVMPSMSPTNTEVAPERTTSSTLLLRSQNKRHDHHHEDENSSRQSRNAKRPTKVSDQSVNVMPYLALLWTGVLSPALQMILMVFSIVFSIIKPILAIGLAFSILVYLSRYLFNRALSNTIAPLCGIPGVSLLNLPFCATYTPAGPIEFDELMTVQSSFEDVLASAAGGATLPLDMKRSEASIRDLKHVVEYSALPSRRELVFEFTGFIETARQAAADLTRFNSRIGRAVDHVLSTNRWTLQVIDGVAAREEAQGAVGKFIQSTFFAPFQGAKVTEQLLLEQYLKHTRAIEEELMDLILEAQALLGILQNLDDRLDVIQGITMRDGVAVKGSRDEILVQLWTWLGGNRSEMKKNNEQMMLLKQLFVYRRTAWEHVSGTLLKLQAIAAGLEDLRERVAAPDVLGVRADVPLRMHIERIQMGVERLEMQRDESRRVEGQARRAVLDRADTDGRRLVEAT